MKTTLVITSIAGDDNPILRNYAENVDAAGIKFIVIGDAKSPNEFALNNCDFYSLEAQAKLDFELSSILPVGHYARKNLGYLQAMSEGAEVIIETDDDNLPKPEFWAERNVAFDGDVYMNAGWVNVYKRFGEGQIWPRGFDLEEINRTIPEATTQAVSHAYCPIQQGMADGNPDVDAVYRLTQALPYFFSKDASVILDKDSICPFNSQNTTWFKAAFLLLYLPSFCSFRMTDIWRSFIAQRILWECGWGLAFHGATVVQDRNDHSLIRDFEDEVSGYLWNAKIVQCLRDLKLEQGEENIAKNLIYCYEALISLGVIRSEELNLVRAWVNDVERTCQI